jgi:hypothetical protein
LAEYVDPKHPLLKIATITVFKKFKAAVSALLKHRFIFSEDDYPYGADGCDPKTGSPKGYPPKPNPADGMVIKPYTKIHKKEYPALAEKLVDAMERVIFDTPGGVHGFVDVELETFPCKYIDMASHLTLHTFILGEYVDSNHPLLKIATLSVFKDFKAAVNALKE